MAISTTSTGSVSTGSSASSLTGSTEKTLGKEDFLKLLVAQLQNQDPLNPMESTEFTAQLAQFSSLEQLVNISSQMKNLLLYQNSLQNTMAVNLIGKDVVFSGGTVNLQGTADISYNLGSDASSVSISVYDSDGNMVRKISLGETSAGDNSYTWDGKDSNGNKLSDGEYSIEVSAVDSSGNTVTASTKSEGTVTGITYNNGVTYLVIDGKTKIQLGDITEINEGGA